VTIWRAVLAPQSEAVGAVADGEALREEARLLAGLVSPALAKFLIEGLEREIGTALIDDGMARKSRLLNRLNAARQARWVQELGEAGFSFVCLKGFATARTIYPDPALRSTGDLDLLIRRRDLAALVDFLSRRGFHFASAGLKRWGFISDASFVPFVGPDGENIDIHIHPDSYPAHLSLSTERVFAAAPRIEAADARFHAPAPEHTLALCITNAAKDKFGIFVAAKLIDAARLIAATPGLDWGEIERLAQDGHFAKPARVFLALLAELGLPSAAVPATLRRPPGGITAGEFRRLVASWQGLFARPEGRGAALRRELLLSTEPRVGLHNALVRLAGLARPRDGLPNLEERRI
jgi:hypothetical protein